VQISENIAVGLIPARGGSKSIPLKNIAQLAGRPLITFVMSAGRASSSLTALYCSTDNDAIARVCRDEGVEVLERPRHLGDDDTPVADVMVHALDLIASRFGFMPGVVVLLQPTSPFVLPWHIDSCVRALLERPDADSAQTVTAVYHNAHAFNQRVIEDGLVRFRFAQERKIAYNKQLKPKHFLFGNVVATRTRALQAGTDCFGNVSLPIEIAREYALDVDTVDDLDYANYLMRTNRVVLESR
jgi:CMP-N,N'-diacetyllegionaminic acid synthase